MPAIRLAPVGARPDLSPYSITIRAATGRVQFVAFAHTSGEALCNALAAPDLAPPLAASVRPLHRRCASA